MDILPAIDNLKQGSGRTMLADCFRILLEAVCLLSHVEQLLPR